MFCKKCGLQINDGSALCQKCGEKKLQEVETTDIYPLPDNKVKKVSPSFFRKVFKTTASKIIAGMLAVVIFATGVVIVVDNQNRNRFVSDSISVLVKPTLKYDDVTSFSEGFAGVEKDGKWGYVDQTGKEVVSPQYDKIEFFKEGLAQVEKDGKWGCVDQTGKEVVSPQYDEIGLFNEGLARVKKYSEYGGRYGYIDKTGKEVVPLKYDGVGYFKDGLAVARIGEAISGDWKCGYIDKTGKEVVPFIYRFAGDFNEGLACVQKDGRYGYIDKSGKIVIPLNFTSASAFSDGLAVVGYGNNIRYIIDKTFDIKNPTNLLTQYTDVYKFKEGFATVSKKGKHGFIDQTGKEVVPPKYDLVSDFDKGFAKVAKEGEGEYGFKYGFIDQTCEEVLPIQYDEIGGFEDGLAWVKKDGKYGFIDQTYREVIPPEYEYALWFYEGLACAKKEGKWGFIDKTGKEVVPFIYRSAGDFYEGLARVRKGKKEGYIDPTGKEVVPFIYDDARSFREGFAWVRKGKKWGILKINESTSNDSSSTTTSAVPTTSSSTDTSATTINIDDYAGKWHIEGQGYDSDYDAYERNLSITNLGGNQLSFDLFYFRLGAIASKITLSGNMVDFTCKDGDLEVKGNLIFNENSITVNITSSNHPYMPVETMTFDSRDAGIDDTLSDLICPRCGREITYGNSCDCTWCDICNAWMLGHGHEEGELPVDSSTAQ